LRFVFLCETHTKQHRHQQHKLKTPTATNQLPIRSDAADAARVSPGGGFGPVAADGYGISYMLATDARLFFHVSARRSSALTDAVRMAGNIRRALEIMRRVCEDA
jgi:hypothetical protein